ncbi:MAG: hypothetical protein IT317_15220 [Anaerolineales bacterium]|nr:hypothetical protein [Anaerolineales bacterium]
MCHDDDATSRGSGLLPNDAPPGARGAAAVIHTSYPEARVRLFGSAHYPDSIGPHSDVDLAIKGVDWPDNLRLWSQVEALEPEFEIDLMDGAIVSPSLRAHIDREGVAL